MEGLIGLSCGETARFSETYDSLMNLQRPAGWGFVQARSMSIAENWNYIARIFLETDAKHLFLTNDDHLYAPDTLLKLLARKVDVVTGLYLSRQLPFHPVLASRIEKSGEVHPRYLRDGERGIVQIEGCGDGCLLLSRKVIETLTKPIWKLGVNQPDACDHDTSFSQQVREAGFTMWADLEVAIGHLAVIPVFPHRDEQGRWSSVMIAGPGVDQVLKVPKAESKISLVV